MVNILRVVPFPAETKQGKKFEKFVLENMINDSDLKISFYELPGTLSIGSVLGEPKMRDTNWVEFVNILCVVPVPTETKQGKKFEKFVLEYLMETFSVSKNKN